jgi:hypothetical protein
MGHLTVPEERRKVRSMTEPLTTLTLFNAIAAAGKTVFDIAQGASNSDAKRQLMEVYDTLMNLKREAADLEDDNRNLKEKLRFKSQDFEFKNPFWYEKIRPDQPLCAKCFASGTIGPMRTIRSEFGTSCTCLVCDTTIYL